MATVAQIVTKRLTLAMKGDLNWGKGGRLKRLEHVLVFVRTDTGVIGVAEAPARPTIYGETPESIEVIIRDYLAPTLIGLDVDDTESLQKVLGSVANNHTAKGALDMALYEARLLSQGKTMAQVCQRANAAVQASYILGIGDLETMLAEAQWVFDRGVRVFKVKIGRDAEHDTAVIKALGSRFAGQGVTLYADANEGLAPQSAARRLEELRELGVAYIEEPLPVQQLKARAALKAEGILPIIADDSCFSPAELERELDFDTFDILNIKPARTGVTQSLGMMARAARAGKGVMLGSQASSGLGTVYTALLATCVKGVYPSEVSFPLKLVADALTVRLEYHAGYLELSRLPELPLCALLANQWGQFAE
jgi:L-alanine-DL-glutamate epimerase-like enolase superfamily enzyme